MTEVLNKIRQLHALLVEKNSDADKAESRLKAQKEKNEEIEKRQKATWANIYARERILDKYEDFDSEKKSLKEKQKKNSEFEKSLNDISEDLTSKKKVISDKEEELDESIKMFKKKNERLDAFEKELKLQKKLMKEKLLEELKGRL